MSESLNQIVISDASVDIMPQKPEYIYTFAAIADDIYAINSKNVLEIIKLTELNRPEKLPSHIAGLFEYNRRIIPIVDIKSVLQIERTTYDINSMIVILSVGTFIFGVLVNKVLDIKKVDIKNIQQAPYQSKNNFIDAIYCADDFQSAILNIASVSDWVQTHAQDEGSDSMSLIPTDYESLEILHQRKLDFIEKSKKNPYSMLGDKDEFVSFSVSGNKYCLKMQDIKGFYKVQETKMTKVPCTPDFVLGLVNIKGDFICVIDIKNYFHAQKASYKGLGTIIILNSDEFKIGILADAIGDNIQIKPEEIQTPNKQDSKNELAQYVKEGEIYMIINVPEMLNNDKLFIR